jgi:S-disulfanyl-L-cysteine oxidoreductase SoxD
MPRPFPYCRSLLVVLGLSGTVVHAQQSGNLSNGIYTADQAARGRSVYQQRCASCHGESLGGASAPPLAGTGFLGAWGGQSLWDLASKIRNTMPANDPGKLTIAQAVDLVAVILQANQYPVGQNELGASEAGLKAVVLPASGRGGPRLPFPATGNMQQLMVGILFPSSNIIFNVQTYDPGAPVKPADTGKEGFSWVQWGAGIYSPWEMVDDAAIAISESAPLLLTPRRCQNGRLAPVDRPDWIQFTEGLAEAGRAAYKAAQTRNQEAVSDATNQLADACFACHRVYRDKRNRASRDPSDKSGRCLP